MAKSAQQIAAEYRRRRLTPTAREMSAQYRYQNQSNRNTPQMNSYAAYAWNQSPEAQNYSITGRMAQTDNTPPTQTPDALLQASFNEAMDWAERNGMANFLRQYHDQFINGQITFEAIKEEWRKTPAYAARFPAMDALRKRGLEMSEDQYIALEREYRSFLNRTGISEEYFDRNDIGELMASDVSPQEAAERALAAVNIVNSQDPNLIRAFRQYYGIKRGDLVAYYLDPERALPVLQQKAETAVIGAEALGAKLDVDRRFASLLQGKGVTQDEAREAFQDTAANKDTAAMLAGLDDTDISIEEQVKANLNLSPKAAKKVKGLASRERARFSGSSAGTSSLGTNVSGSY